MWATIVKLLAPELIKRIPAGLKLLDQKMEKFERKHKRKMTPKEKKRYYEIVKNNDRRELNRLFNGDDWVSTQYGEEKD